VAEDSELDWAKAAGRIAATSSCDGRNVLDPDMLRTLGFVYEGIGRPVV
jgi:hypothetical protein